VLTVLLGTVLAACAANPPPGDTRAPEWTTGRWERACRFDRDVLAEVSGLTASRRHPGVLWALNDSGNAATLIALDATTCAVRARATVQAPNTDWEALAAGSRKGRPVLFIGDIGDNTGSRASVAVVEVPEPGLGTTTVTARTHRFTYPDGPVDAEGLMASGTRVWVVTKQFRGAVFRVRLAAGTAERVGSAPAYATDAALSSIDDVFAIRDYPTLTRYRGLPPGQRLGRSTPPQQPQAEAVAFSADGRWLYTASEGDRRLLRAPVQR
jgi:hypothetical protein